MNGPVWLDIAKKYLGEREVKGPHHNPDILKWWRDIGAPFKDDETPWCGAFVGGVLTEAHLRVVPGGASARAWLQLETKIDRAAVGCVVVFWRGSPGSGQGHVGFVCGKDQAGNLMVIGGNQGDAVTIKPFAKTRVLGYRWPNVAPSPERYNLPIINSDGKLSEDEA